MKLRALVVALVPTLAGVVLAASQAERLLNTVLGIREEVKARPRDYVQTLQAVTRSQ